MTRAITTGTAAYARGVTRYLRHADTIVPRRDYPAAAFLAGGNRRSRDSAAGTADAAG